MKNKYYLIFFGILITFIVTAIFFHIAYSPVSQKFDKDSLVIYSAERMDIMETVIPLFEEKYGIKDGETDYTKILT